MSWPRSGAAALMLAAALALAGCQVRPLYATGGPGSAPQQALPAILVETPANRMEQVYRNALLFAFTGGAEPAAPRYRLTYRLNVRELEIAVQRTSGTPNAYQLRGDLSFLLEDLATGQPIAGEAVSAVDSYTRSSQNFANLRARRDAEDRLMKALAERTEARLAAYFAVN